LNLQQNKVSFLVGLVRVNNNMKTDDTDHLECIKNKLSLSFYLAYYTEVCNEYMATRVNVEMVTTRLQHVRFGRIGISTPYLSHTRYARCHRP